MDYTDAQEWIAKEQVKSEKRVQYLHDIATAANQMALHNSPINKEKFLCTLFNVVHLTLSCETITLSMARIHVLIEKRIEMSEFMDVFMPLDYLEKMALVFGATARHFIDKKMRTN